MLKKTLFTTASLLLVNLGLIAQQKITEFKVGGLLSKDFSSDSEYNSSESLLTLPMAGISFYSKTNENFWFSQPMVHFCCVFISFARACFNLYGNHKVLRIYAIGPWTALQPLTAALGPGPYHGTMGGEGPSGPQPDTSDADVTVTSNSNNIL